MLGSAVSSSTPTDFHPSPHIGGPDALPLMKRHEPAGLPRGCPYRAVGMHKAVQSAMGLPRRSSSAAWMLAFLTPAEVRSSFMMPFRSLANMPVARTTIDGAGNRHRPENNPHGLRF